MDRAVDYRVHSSCGHQSHVLVHNESLEALVIQELGDLDALTAASFDHLVGAGESGTQY